MMMMMMMKFWNTQPFMKTSNVDDEHITQTYTIVVVVIYCSSSIVWYGGGGCVSISIDWRYMQMRFIYVMKK